MQNQEHGFALSNQNSSAYLFYCEKDHKSLIVLYTKSSISRSQRTLCYTIGNKWATKPTSTKPTSTFDEISSGDPVYKTLLRQIIPVTVMKSRRWQCCLWDIKHDTVMILLQELMNHLWHHVTMMTLPPGAQTLQSSFTNLGFVGICSPLHQQVFLLSTNKKQNRTHDHVMIMYQYQFCLRQVSL